MTLLNTADDKTLLGHIRDLSLAIFFMISYLVVSDIWYANFNRASTQLPPVSILTSLDLDLTSGVSEFIIGAGELMQNPGPKSAEADHIRLWRDSAGEWQISNIAARRKLAFRYEDGTRVSSLDFPLTGTSTIALGDVSYTLSIPSLGVLDIGQVGGKSIQVNTDENCNWSYKLKVSTGELSSPANCVIATIGGSISGVLGDKADTFHFSQIGAPENAVTINWRKGQFFLTLGAGRLVRICQKSTDCEILGRHSWPLVSTEFGKLSYLFAGLTGYIVELDYDALSLVADSKPHWLNQENFDLSQANWRAMPNKSQMSPVTTAFGGNNPPSLFSAAALIFSNLYLDEPLKFVGILFCFFIVYICYLLASRKKRAFLDTEIGFLLAVIGCMLLPIAIGEARIIRIRPATYLDPTGLALMLLVLIYPARWSTGFVPQKFRLSIRILLKLMLVLVILAIAYFWIRYPFSDSFAVLGSTPAERLQISVFSSHVSLILLFLTTGLIFVISQLFKTRLSIILCVFWLALMVIVGAGAVNAFQLNFGNDNGSYLELYSTHIAVLACLAFGASSTIIFDFTGIRRSFRMFLAGDTLQSKSLYLVGGAFLFVIILVWALTGTETGIAGLQPSELAKSALCILFGLLVTTALKSRNTLLGRLERGRVIYPLLAYLFVFGALVSASALLLDMSPILIQLAVFIFLALCVAMTTVFRHFWLALFAGVSFSIYAYVSGFDIGHDSKMLFGFQLLIFVLVLVSISRSGQHVHAAQGILDMPWKNRNKRTGIWALFKTGGAQASVSSSNEGLAVTPPWRFVMRRPEIWFDSLFRHAIELAAVIVIIFVSLFGWFIVSQSQSAETMLKATTFKYVGTPSERILAWRDASYDQTPGVVVYADLSQQVLDSRVVIARSGCGLTDALRFSEGSTMAALFDNSSGESIHHDLFRSVTNGVTRITDYLGGYGGCASKPVGIKTGKNTKQAMQVPAVQDDFIVAFFIHTFGKDSAIFLMFFQAVLFASMISTAASSAMFGWRNPSDYDVGIAAGFVVAGLAIVLASQFILSWSNAFGLFPVVGQPMTFLSLGGSHHLFVAVPAVMLTVFVQLVFLDETKRGQIDRAMLVRSVS